MVEEQLSAKVALAIVTEAVQTPASATTLTSDAALTVGSILSCTVTVAVVVTVLPEGSETESVTVLAPRLAQVKEEGDTLRVTPQASDEPLFTWAAVIEAVPLAARFTVTF